jgi:hypothetical protein
MCYFQMKAIISFSKFLFWLLSSQENPSSSIFSLISFSTLWIKKKNQGKSSFIKCDSGGKSICVKQKRNIFEKGHGYISTCLLFRKNSIEWRLKNMKNHLKHFFDGKIKRSWRNSFERFLSLLYRVTSLSPLTIISISLSLSLSISLLSLPCLVFSARILMISKKKKKKKNRWQLVHSATAIAIEESTYTSVCIKKTYIYIHVEK